MEGEEVEEEEKEEYGHTFVIVRPGRRGTG